MSLAAVRDIRAVTVLAALCLVLGVGACADGDEEANTITRPTQVQKAPLDSIDCGSIEPSNPVTDAPVGIRASQLDCATAREVVRKFSLEGVLGPLGFACSDPTASAPTRSCSKDGQVVSWRIEVR